MITIACQECGKLFQTWPSRRGRFCSHQCYAKWVSQNRRGPAHPMFGKHHSAESLQRMRLKHAKISGGELNPNWRGGIYTTKGGYVQVSLHLLTKTEQKQLASMAVRGRLYIPEHRLVMAQLLGRALTPAETVHHRNGIKDDNRPENLQIRDASDHKKEHWNLIREVQELRAENERLKSLLAISPPLG